MNKETRVELLFLTILPDITKNIACWKIIRLLPKTLVNEDFGP
jgi:hypothetical protein